jgi:enoyl-CoA hydratase/carnithine racemase
MTESNILLSEFDSGVVTLTLNRPPQFNALSSELLNALSAELDNIATDQKIRAVIIAANGKAFCAGHDLKQMRQKEDKASHQDLFTSCSEVMMKLLNLPQPVVARVHGMATAAGCQLVATCDLAVASSEARFAVSGIRVGLFCSTPAVALSRNISRKRAMEMLMTGEFIDAGTALDYGLVNRVVDPELLDHTVNELVTQITRHPPRVVALGKKMFYQQIAQDIGNAYCGATEAISGNMMLEETREGIDAFIEKRAPNWDL